MIEKSTLKPSRELQAALEAARGAMVKRTKIEESIQQAIALQRAAEARLQSAMEHLGDVEADLILSGGESPNEEPHRALTTARDVCDSLAARISGLKRRLIQHDEEILAAAAPLGQLREEFSRQVVAEFRKTFIKASEQFAEAVRTGIGLGEGLGYQFFDLAEARIFESAMDKMIPIVYAPQEISNKTRASACASVSAVKDTVEEIGRLVDAIELARRAREEKERVPAPRPHQQIPGTWPGMPESEWLEAQDVFRNRLSPTVEVATSYGGTIAG